MSDPGESSVAAAWHCLSTQTPSRVAPQPAGVQRKQEAGEWLGMGAQALISLATESQRSRPHFNLEGESDE
jgi:hypothetical protein